VRRLVALLLGLGWLSTSAAVALVAPPATLLELPWAQIAVGCLISLWGGLARTATRVLGAQREGAELKLWRELAKDLIAASLVGFVAFGLSAWQEWNVWLLAVLLPLAGYGGARFLEPLTDAAVRRMTGVLGGADNRREPE
jgi:hypothetical protein